MSTPYESADLLLRLYGLRTEPEMRAARDWFFTRFHPQSAAEVFAVWMGTESAPYRMVTTYWEMAASLVRHGAIDEAMFHAANTEYVGVIAKLGPYLAELRERSGTPDYLAQLEALVTAMPDAEARLTAMRRYMRHKASQHAAPAAEPGA
ncbi:MAG TPA: hypothetical protein VFX98_14990 [Longimicrobiaceae bacterium]|nr:hypothetical protein [Longimicrobiaceae bacterium]